MVHKVFTWPYGGGEVFLSFACNGWIDRTAMTLVEGSSEIFQVICNLPVGCYQYKFLVDGVWQFDGQQPRVEDEYGRISNVILVKEPERISLSLHGSAFTPSMDIDNTGNMRDKASSSSVTNRGLELPFFDANTDISCRHLCMHLSSHKIHELIPNSSKVFALDVDVTVKEAFHVMYKQGLAVVPIWDGNRQQFSGMMTASDFILILMELHKNRGMLPDEQLEGYTISAWKEGKPRLPYGGVVGAAQLIFGRPLIQAGPDESLRDAALRLLQNKISTVPIIHSSEGGSLPQLLHIACLGRILKHICRHFKDHIDHLPLLQQPVGSLPLGTWTGGGGSNHLLALRPSDTLSSALNIMIEAQISSIPIVNGEGSLINVYSRSDITSFANNNAYARVQLDQTIMSQVLELVDGRRYQTCTRSDPLFVVMERLSDPVVRRLIVIEVGSQRVEGIITLSDVFKFILR